MSNYQGKNIREILIELITNPETALETIAMACDAIAADCRWNMYFVGSIKKTRSPTSIVEIIYEYEDITETCIEALSDFSVNNNSDVLREKILNITAKINRLFKKYK